MNTSNTTTRDAADVHAATAASSYSRQDDTYDLVIVGLGPAGATLARLLSPRFRVLAIDKKTLGEEGEGPTPLPDGDVWQDVLPPIGKNGRGVFRKPCGGLLSPDAQKSLAAFDLTLPTDILVDPQIFSVRVLDLTSGITRYYQRCYINMDRHRFDQWLMSLIPDSIDMELGASVRFVQREEQHFRIGYKRYDGAEREVTARIVVGADGAFSQVRRLLYPTEKPRVYTSIQQWFHDENPSPFYSCVFDSQVTDCCSWSISKDGYFIFGGAYPVKGARAAFERQKQRLALEGFRFGDVVRTEACQVMRPSGLSDFRCGHDGGLLIGEAAGLISASSLEGISFAFDSARVLAEVLNAHGCVPDVAKRYTTAVASLRRKAIAKIWKAHVIDSPVLRGAIMRTGITSIRMIPSRGATT